jgi:hypothetical protein
MPQFFARLGAAVLASVCGASAVHAMPFGIFDPRSMAMGGTGVSSGSSGNAAYFNPALLAAARPKDRFSFEMIVAARAADPNNLADDIDKLDKSGKNLSDALTQFNQAPTLTLAQQNAAGNLATKMDAFRADLITVNNKTLEANLFASPLTVGVPGKDLGWGIYAGARADIGAKLFFESGDNQKLIDYRDAAQLFSNTGSSAALTALLGTYGNGTTLTDPALQSHLDVRGVVIEEFGISLAREFQTSWDNFSLGITPKHVRVLTFDYRVNPQQSEITADKGRLDYTGANFDIGMAKDLGSGFKGGLVAKNVIAHSYTTALGNTIQLKPQVRAGVSHHTTRTTLALDLDLTENAPTGFDKPTRYAGIGAELDIWSFLQLRLGYRSDLTGNYPSIPSVGLGLSIFGLHIDAGAAGRNKEEFTAAVQLGFRF